MSEERDCPGCSEPMITEERGVTRRWMCNQIGCDYHERMFTDAQLQDVYDAIDEDNWIANRDGNGDAGAR